MTSKLSEIEAEPLELSRAGREVWLAKVPHFVSEAWRSPASGAADVGRLRMVVDPTAEPGTPAAAPQMTVHVTGNEAAAMPREFQLNIHSGFAPMQLFSESTQGQVAVEGRITAKFDMQPRSVDAAYHRLFQDRVIKATSKTRYSQVLDEDRRTGTTIIPINDERAKGLAPLAPGAKKSDTRRARDLSTDDLRDLLFSLFERKQRWTLKDLVAETRQPHSFLKEVLNDVAVYNKRGEFQGSYELKADFKPVEDGQAGPVKQEL
ncbi:Transcription initiation factor IIF beta subunit [Klebsormidium nitens]|uniref:Transcription initiation factor IIF beta subunit n=1 Tax=Klebsormidium nitens TaxID=105231 RepID=A0A0U9HT46_KLENI|nr:Transcription initiation factor IIF beta subunit [Klebsormidium nitens]|eukprot:GAQ90045.1 Transcription initiation factor IIF beta subunit [Klebsormidium nitens]